MRAVLLICVVLVGCAAPLRGPRSADAVVVVFADGFHSGIILERAAVPPRLLPAKASTPWVALHFGERRWITGEADGAIDALRLAICPGDGGVQVDAIDWWVHDRGGTVPSDVRVWEFPISAAELRGLQARLDSWVATDAVRQPIRPGGCWWPSVHAWSLRTDCHDFTADVLAGADIHVERPPIMWAGPLRAALDQAWSDRDAAP